MSGISPRTLRAALAALDAVQRSASGHHAERLAEEFDRASRELEDALSSSRQRLAVDGVAGAGWSRLVGAVEAARRLGVSKRTIQRRAAAGELPGELIEGRWVIYWTEEQDVGREQARRGA